MADDRNITGSKVILRAAGMQDQGMLLGLTWDPEIVKVTKGYRGWRLLKPMWRMQEPAA